MDVKHWLEELGLAQYAEAFAANDIDTDALSALEDGDLRELGVASLGHRKKLLAGIRSLNGAAPISTPPATATDIDARPAGERRQVTILFADLSGYTELANSVDAEELRAIIDRMFAAIDAIIENYGGSIDKHIGDEVMALFGAPIAHSDDPARAVLAAVEIHAAIATLSAELKRPLSVHLGIASGSVVAGGVGDHGRDEYTVLGDSVNLAARLNSRAKPGETLVSDAVRRAAAGVARFEALGEVEVKGFPDPVPAFRIGALGTFRNRADAGPFVGRRIELSQFSASIDACRETGAGQTIVLRGEAGMGKTRLAEEFSAIAEKRGFAVHRGLVLDFGVGKDQDAIRALLRGMLGIASGATETERASSADTAIRAGYLDADALPFLNDLLGLEQSRADSATYEAMDNATRSDGKRMLVATLLRGISANSPVMLIVEDVHWADPPILAFLAVLAATVGDCPALLVLTTRIEGDPLDLNWRSSTHGAPLQTIDLAPLREPEAAEMAKGFLTANNQFAAASIARAEGNPLFLEQLLRNAEERGSDEIPASIQSLVLSRMDRLSPADKRALQAASVIGQRFAPDAVRFLVDDESYTCQGLIQHHLVRPEGESFLFAHALIQEGVYSSLLKPAKRQLHLRAAEWYAGQDPVLEAQHLDRAGDARAPGAYLAAAREQGMKYHFETALQHLDRGIALAVDVAQRCSLIGCRGEMLYAVGDITGSTAAFESILELAETDEQRVPAWIGFAEAMRLVDRIEDGLAALQKAEAAATGQDLNLAHIHHLRGNLLFPSGDYDACRAEHEKALAHAERAGSVEYTAKALGGLGDAYYASGHMLTAYSYLEQCLELARKNALGSIEVAYTFMRGDTAIFQGRIAEGVRDAKRSREMAARVGNRRAEAFAGWIDVTSAFFSTELEPAAILATLERMKALIDQMGLKRVIPLVHVGEALLALNERDYKAVDTLMDKAHEATRVSGIGFAGPWILGIHAMWTRDPKRRAEVMAEAERILASTPVVSHNYIFFYQAAIEVSISVGNWDEVNRFAGLLDDYMSREPTPLTDLVIARGRALARHGQGDTDPGLIEELRALRLKAAEFGFDRALPALDAALADL